MAPKITNAAYKPTTTSATADDAILRRVDHPRANVGTVSPLAPGRKALAHIRYATLIGGARIGPIRRGSTGSHRYGRPRRGSRPQQPAVVAASMHTEQL